MEKKHHEALLLLLTGLFILSCPFGALAQSDNPSFDEHIRLLRCKQNLTGFAPTTPQPALPNSKLTSMNAALLKKGALVFGVKGTRVLMTLDADTPGLASDEKSESSYGYVRVALFDKKGEFIQGEVLAHNILPALSEEAYQELKAKEKEHLEKQRLVHEEEEQREAEHLQEQIKLFDEALQPENPARPFALDYIAAKWVEQTARANKAATLLGGSDDGVDAKQVVFLAKTLGQKGVLVFFDADAPVASRLAKVLGSQGIGITAHAQNPLEKLSGKDSLVVTIKNPYLRMTAFAESKHVTMTTDSVTGWGLLFEDKVAGVVDSGAGTTNHALRDWSLKVSPRWGVRGYSAVASDSKKQSTKLIAAKSGSPSGKESFIPPTLSFDPRETFASISTYSKGDFLTNLLNYLAEMQASEGELNQILIANTPHAVVFGSSMGDDQYKKLVFDSTTELSKLGFSISTGGAGGYMEVANDAARKAGGISIGIPLSGRVLQTEKFVARESHDLTIPSSDYRTRIPLLLHRKDIVIVAPGGRGTGKEIATTFVKEGGNLENVSHIIFLSEDFYGDVFTALKESSLPASFKAKLHLVKSASEINSLFSLTQP